MSVVIEFTNENNKKDLKMACVFTSHGSVIIYLSLWKENKSKSNEIIGIIVSQGRSMTSTMFVFKSVRTWTQSIGVKLRMLITY